MNGKVVTVAALLGFATELAGHEGGPSRFNYHEHVRPVLLKACGGCHRAGGAAPMTLLDYHEVVPWTRTMMIQVLEGRMPPWLPAEGIGDFESARILSASEVDLLIDWAVGELPEGEPPSGDEQPDEDPFAEESSPSSAAEAAWSNGEPDLVLRPASAVAIEAEEKEKQVCLSLPSGLEAPRFAKRFEVRPGIATVVRRATAYEGVSCETGARPLFTWLPDQGSIDVLDGMGELLPPGSSLAVDVLYRRGWVDEGMAFSDRTEVGIWFTSAAEPIQSVRVDGVAHAFPAPVDLLAIFPDPVSEDVPWRVELALPDGEVLPLLVIERYDPLWREKYRLRDPLPIPQGAEIRLSRPAAWLDYKGRSSAGTR